MNDKTKQLDAAFDKWCRDEGSAPPSNIMDCDEHYRHVARIAWNNGAYKAEQPTVKQSLTVQQAQQQLDDLTVWKARALQAEAVVAKFMQQPAQQEPVAFEIRAFNATQALIKRADVAQEKADVLERGFGSETDVTIVPLYTSPTASKPWVGLTDEQIQAIAFEAVKDNWDWLKFARAIEAKLREKNA